MIESLSQQGVNVVVTGSGINELMLHYLNKAGMVVVKVLSKFELRRLCKVTGATALPKMVEIL